jgi:hypothetical protein
MEDLKILILKNLFFSIFVDPFSQPIDEIQTKAEQFQIKFTKVKQFQIS